MVKFQVRRTHWRDQISAEPIPGADQSNLTRFAPGDSIPRTKGIVEQKSLPAIRAPNVIAPYR